MAITEFLFKKFADALWRAAESGILSSNSDWISKRKLKTRLENSAIRALDELEPLFAAEGLSSEKQNFVFDACLTELIPLLETPDEFFAGSLTGEKLYRRRYGESGLPQSIVEEGLEQAFRLVYPRIADRFCA